MKKIKVMIADDELPALKLTESYVNQLPALELIALCGSADEVIEISRKYPADLYLLDIQMPGMNGLELSKRLPEHAGVVFTTAFPEYALDGFKVNAIDYLLKPFDFEEFNKAIKKVLLRIENRLEKTEGFFVKTEYHLEKIKFNQLLFAESNRDYVRIYVAGKEEPVVTQMPLKDLEDQLPASDFMRVHRSFIINLHAIELVERNRISIKNHQIPVADSYRTEFQNYLKKHTL